MCSREGFGRGTGRSAHRSHPSGGDSSVSDDSTGGNSLGVHLPIIPGPSVLAALAIGLARRRASAASG
jgi:hypothetical protein